MNWRVHFTTLINQEDACIIVSFAATPTPQPPKNHKQRRRQSCFLFHVAKGLLPFMSLLLLCLWRYGNNKPDDVWYLGTICKFYARGWSVLKIIEPLDRWTSPSNKLIMGNSSDKTEENLQLKTSWIEKKLKRFETVSESNQQNKSNYHVFVQKIPKHNHSWSPYVSRNYHKHKLEHAVWGNELIVH